ncbi:fumarylacetoacetate hydrolase family protein [Micromonospora sp. WMMA1923]|uniref:fumarylacetoacetate hydrolase family protein n=1 Tax=Micromonospora sp. WMMA1923 TaxID=3404125 RepID=UPI003B94A380
MRLGRMLLDGQWRTVSVRPDEQEVVVLPADLGSVDDLVRGGPPALAAAQAAQSTAPVRRLDPALLGAPLTRFNRDILCTGWNYWAHYEESAGRREGQDPAERPRHPTFFTKGPDTVVGPYDDIRYDARVSDRWDYEAEVALVIGRVGRSIPAERALEHVFGYLVANDVSQRDLQRAHGGQWLKGKSIDDTMPLGPWVTTADEIGDPAALRIRCLVNDEVRQDAVTGQMAFSVAQLIAELSWGMTLRPGDVLLTGTPAGIGNARDPQVFLAPGDVVTTEVDRLGTLHNRVVQL